MDKQTALSVFLADSAGVAPDSFASRAAAQAAAGLVGVFVPSTIDKDRPAGDDIFERRVESAQLLLNGLFGGSSAFSSFAFPCRGGSVHGGRVISERGLFVVSFVSGGLQVDDSRWTKLLRAAGSFRILWRQAAVGVFGPGGYQEIE